jgi:hypothetical protein
MGREKCRDTETSKEALQLSKWDDIGFDHYGNRGEHRGVLFVDVFQRKQNLLVDWM